MAQLDRVTVAKMKEKMNEMNAEVLLRAFVTASTVMSAANTEPLPFCKLCEEGLHVNGTCSLGCPCHKARALFSGGESQPE